MRRMIAVAVAALAVGGMAVSGGPARADNDGVVAAGFAGFALGVLFPFVNGYEYHQSGYWYVRDPRYLRYPVSYYKWYAPAGGYVYVGPNWEQWYHYREAVYAPPPYFTVPPRRYVYLPPVPDYYGGAGPFAGSR